MHTSVVVVGVLVCLRRQASVLVSTNIRPQPAATPHTPEDLELRSRQLKVTLSNTATAVPTATAQDRQTQTKCVAGLNITQVLIVQCAQLARRASRARLYSCC